jgi:hypothetical protein
MTREVTEILHVYPFPGNVRELENAIRRAIAVCSGDVITLDCLPPEIRSIPSLPPRAPTEHALLADRPTMDELERRYLRFVLDESGGNRRRAANVLGLDRRTVRRLISRFQLRAVVEPETVTDAENLDRRLRQQFSGDRFLSGHFQQPRFFQHACAVLALAFCQTLAAQTPLLEARVSSLSGPVLLSKNSLPLQTLGRGDTLSPGDEIDTRSGGRITIVMTDGSLVVVLPDSRVILKTIVRPVPSESSSTFL